jgi:UDP-N-acetylglucosamine--N-acetylmuramyl-(pentapeptide) pyrophosphoryl-undecaprenol N-acetylglucosamine transferase
LPSILIPLPSSAEGHQEKNANALEAAGAAFVIHEKDLSPNSLLRAINKIIDDEKLRGEMATQSRKLGRPGAADELVDIVVSLSRGQA